MSDGPDHAEPGEHPAPRLVISCQQVKWTKVPHCFIEPRRLTSCSGLRMYTRITASSLFPLSNVSGSGMLSQENGKVQTSGTRGVCILRFELSQPWNRKEHPMAEPVTTSNKNTRRIAGDMCRQAHRRSSRAPLPWLGLIVEEAMEGRAPALRRT